MKGPRCLTFTPVTPFTSVSVGVLCSLAEPHLTTEEGGSGIGSE